MIAALCTPQAPVLILSWSVVVVVGVACCCCIPFRLALMLVLTFAPCTLTFAPCACGGSHRQQLTVVVFLPQTLAQRLHLHPRWFHPLQLAPVVFFLPPTGADTGTLGQLALCAGGVYIDTTTTTTTTTAQSAMHAFSICATALGKKTTTSASYCGPGPAPAPFRGSEAASPLLACTMQQAHVILHKGLRIWGGKSMARLYASYYACCIVHANSGDAASDPLNGAGAGPGTQ